VEGMKPTARLHKILASYQFGGLRLPSGDFTGSDQEVADYLLETHFPGFQPCYSGQDTYRGGLAGGIGGCGLRQNQMGY
jgi:hypothetical protein